MRSTVVTEAAGNEQQKSPVQAFFRGLGAAWEHFVSFLSNTWRAIVRGHRTDYAVIRMEQELSERTPEQPWYYSYLPTYKPPLSIEALDNVLKRIAHDPDLRGVVFLFKGPGLSLSQAQSISALF